MAGKRVSSGSRLLLTQRRLRASVPTRFVTIVILALVSIFVHATASPAAIPAVLEVGRELRNVSMPFAGRYNANADVDADGSADADARRSSSTETTASADDNGDVREGRMFGLHGLRPSMGYEIKISFPASLPARFHLALMAVDPEAATGSDQEGAAGAWGDLASGLAAKSRKMLDTEKVIFRTDKHSNVLLQGRPLVPSAAVHVWAEPTAVFPGGSREGSGDVLFNIVCEELRLGIPGKGFEVCAEALTVWWMLRASPHYSTFTAGSRGFSGRNGSNGGSGSGTLTEARDIDIDVPDYSLLFNEARTAKTEGKAPRVVPKYGEEMADVPTKRIEVYLPPPSPQSSPKHRTGCCLPLFGRR
ncbi:unnamed protein product [Closterium sp. NIES-65]|nr:unnamed protein product [Closterium sp. NIES-65]